MRAPLIFRYLIPSLLILLAVGTATPSSAQTPVSRAVPKECAELIDQRGTDATPIIQRGHQFDKSSHEGVVILRELLCKVHDDGRAYSIYHNVYQALTQEGVEAIAQERYGFDAKLFNVHLAMARSIAPDGTTKDIADNAAFIERGRQSGSSQLYNSDHSLVVIFPDVKVGGCVESIVIYEEVTPRMPNEFSRALTMGTGWAVVESVYEIDMPTAVFERLNQHQLGDDIPEQQSLPTSDGRTRLAWRASNLKASFNEQSKAPAEQVGPCVFLSTLPDWNAFAKWYSSVLEPKSTMSDEMTALVDEWTAGIDDQRVILDVLFEKVANDVRYTGLEFGLSGLQPYDCKEVWDHQYGDCKDKSNLLRTMLAHKGIDSYLSLVNTDHLGVVIKEIADYRPFDHAILSVEIEPGEWIFCDPTIEHGSPGMLSPPSADRDVLAIRGDEALWLKSPKVDDLRYCYSFDLELTPTNILVGSMDVTGEHFGAVSVGGRYFGVNRDSTISGMTSAAGSFIPGAYAIDYQLAPHESPTAPSSVTNRSFIVTTALQADNNGRIHIPFPMTNKLVYDYDYDTTRTSDYFQWPETIEVTLNLKLPKGWTPDALPAELESTNPYHTANASWHYDEETSTCTGKLTFSTPTSRIPAEKIEGAIDTTRALFTWLKSPLVISPDSSNNAPPETKLTLPDIPTGSGMVAFINARFPLSGNRANRKRALEQVADRFPDDAVTMFKANAELAFVEFHNNELDTALPMLTALVENAPDGVAPSARHFVRYMTALTLHNLERNEEALATLRPLIDADDVSDFRMGWSLTIAGDMSTTDQKTSPEGMEFYRRACAIDGDHVSDASTALFVQYCLTGDQSAAVAWVHDVLTMPSERNDEFVRGMYSKLTEMDAPDAITEAATAVSAACASPPANVNEDVLKFTASYDDHLRTMAVRKTCAAAAYAKLLTVLEASSPTLESLIDADLPPLDANTRDEHEARIDQLLDNDDIGFILATTSYFRDHEPNEYFSYYLWRLVSSLRIREESEQIPRDQQLTPQILEIGAMLSPTDGNYWEIEFVNGQWLMAGELWDEAIDLFKAQREHPDFDQDFLLSSTEKQGLCHERLGQWQQAIDCHVMHADKRKDFRSVPFLLVRAGVLMVRLGDYDRALETWTLLHDVPENFITESSHEVDIQEAITLSKQPEKLVAYWKSTEKWWNKSVRRQLVKAGVKLKPIAIRPYLTDSGAEIEQALETLAAEENASDYIIAALPVIDYLRWSPNGAAYIYQVLNTNAPEMGKSQDVALDEILVALTPSVELLGSPEAVAVATRMQVAILYDLGRPDDALPLVKKYIKRIREHDRFHQEYTTWIYMICANQPGDDLDDAMDVALKLWGEGITGMDAQKFGNTLSSALELSDRLQEALVITNASLKMDGSDSLARRQLIERKTNLQQQLDSDGKFAKGIATWVAGVKPVWYDVVAPHSLDDAGKPQARAEQIKHQLLVVQSADRSVEARLNAWQVAVSEIAATKPRWSESLAFIEHALDCDAIPEATRAQLLWIEYVDFCYAGRPKDARSLRNHPLFKTLSDRALKELSPRLMDIASAIRYQDVDQHVENIETIANEMVDDTAIEMIALSLGHLVLLEAFDEHTAIRNSIKSWEFEDNTFAFKVGYQMGLTGQFNNGRKTVELASALREIVRPRLTELAANAPKDWRDWRTDFALQGLTADAYNGVLAKRALDTTVDSPNTLLRMILVSDPWTETINTPTTNTIGQGASAVLASDVNGGTKMISMISLLSAANQSDGLLAEIATAFDKHEQIVAESPELILIRILLDAEISFRKNGTCDIAPLLASPDKNYVFKRAPLTNTGTSIALINDNQSSLNAVIEKVKQPKNDDQYAMPIEHVFHIVALDAAGRTNDLTPAKDEAAATMDLLIANLWTAPDIFNYITLVEIAIACDRTDDIPELLHQRVIERQSLGNADIAKVLHAYASEDWPAMLESARRVTVSSPDETDSDYRLALALKMNNQTDDAKTLLEKVVAMGCINDAHYARCLILLNELNEAADVTE